MYGFVCMRWSIDGLEDYVIINIQYFSDDQIRTLEYKMYFKMCYFGSDVPCNLICKATSNKKY